MARVLTNTISLAYAVETSLGTPSTEWYTLEPNAITTFGAEITTIAREPINNNRQRIKGTITDLTSTTEFDHDITISAFNSFIEGFCFCTAHNDNIIVGVTGAGASNNEFILSSNLSVYGGGRLVFSSTEYASLLAAKGFFNSVNNGLFQVKNDPVSTDGTIEVLSSLVSETVSNASVELAGIRFLDATTDIILAYSSSTKKLTLTVAAGLTSFNWTNVGLTLGQMLHIGSATKSGGDIQHAAKATLDDDMYGFARVYTISSHVLVLDKVDVSLQVTTTISLGSTLDILYGLFIKTVPVTAGNYLQRSFQFEIAFPDLGANNTTMYQYSVGNICNTASFNLTLAEKATVSFGFTGTDTENPVANQKTGASAAKTPISNVAFNTCSDIARLRIVNIDDDGISTDFKSLTFTLNNNASPEKVLGSLGAKYINVGNFEIDIEAQLLFTNAEVIEKIRDNATVTMDFIIKNDDGGIVIDIPAMTLGGGNREFPANESILINLEGIAILDTRFNTALGISIFPILP